MVPYFGYIRVMARFCTLVYVCLMAGTVDTRPHQIHNLLLYPDKKAWCDSKEVQMVITHPDCISQAFNNRVCVGQCFSYVTPKTKPENRAEDKLQYCDRCQPVNTTWTKVTLSCPNNPQYSEFVKEVELITDCSCQPCYPDLVPDEEADHLHGFNEDDEEEEPEFSQEEYLEHARKKLTGNDQQVVASSAEVEKHGKKKVKEQLLHLRRNHDHQ